MTIRERLERLLEPVPEAGCWIFTGKWRTGTGYGDLRTPTGSELAHRAAYRCFVGTIPEGLVVRHKCDTRSCCNPDHLELGTQKDNIHDMIKRGRRVIQYGMDASNARFSDELIQQVRESKLSTRKASAVFGISKTYISEIRQGNYRK